ncbi:MAG: hypothetical protein E7460_08860 [Ruminococcaceae bacterium]|nr:hypothetical protein [Oscillospiraceae bacterium]
MRSLSDAIEQHAREYPKMRPADAVKLIYQNEFGGEHMITNEDATLEYLKKEMAPIAPDSRPPFTPIGNHRSRLELASQTAAALGPELINRMFVFSSNRGGTMESFEEKLERLRDSVDEGIFSFTPADYDSFLEKYRASGCPALHHSETYREAYLPSYRVVDSGFARIAELMVKISALLSRGVPVVVAIDGSAASGKTNASRLLAGVFGASVIHADDFFLPFDMRSKERLSEPGGNFHRERFAAEVIPNLRMGLEFTYNAFNCSTGELSPVTVSPRRLTVVEGAYCLHPALGKYADLTVFSPISPDKQELRILRRDGKEMFDKFDRIWIPMEKKYNKAFGIADSCDMVLPG